MTPYDTLRDRIMSGSVALPPSYFASSTAEFSVTAENAEMRVSKLRAEVSDDAGDVAMALAFAVYQEERKKVRSAVDRLGDLVRCHD